MFLIGAAAAGFAAGRMIRASRGGDDDEAGGQYGADTYRMTGDGRGVNAGYRTQPPVAAVYPAPATYASVPPAGSLADDDVLLADPDVAVRAPGGDYDPGLR